MKFKIVKVSILLVAILLVGCQEQTRLSVGEDNTRAIYVEDSGLVSVNICLENEGRKTPVDDPFIIDFEILGQLDDVVDESRSMLKIDSRNMDDWSGSGPYCVGTTLFLSEHVYTEDVKNMVHNGDIEVVVNDLNGDEILNDVIDEFAIGDEEGNVVDD